MRWKRKCRDSLTAIHDQVNDDEHGLAASRNGQVREHQEILGAITTVATDLQTQNRELLEQRGHLIGGLAENRTDIHALLTELTQEPPGPASADSGDSPSGPAPTSSAAFGNPGASGAQGGGSDGRDTATPDSGDEGVLMGGIGQQPDHTPDLDRT